MNKIISSLVLLSSLSANSLAHAEMKTVPIGLGEPDAPLVVKGQVLKKRCLAWNKNLSELQLRLQFTNLTRTQLILNKRDLSIVAVKYFAFIDRGKDMVHLGELGKTGGGYSPAYDQELVGDRPNTNFVVLSPRQSYVMEAKETIPLIESAHETQRRLGHIDKYQIELKIATWTTYSVLADSLRVKWNKFGLLWTHTIWSDPIEFTFIRERKCRN